MTNAPRPLLIVTYIIALLAMVVIISHAVDPLPTQYESQATQDETHSSVWWREQGDVLVGQLSQTGVMSTQINLTARGTLADKDMLLGAMLAGQAALQEVDTLMSRYQPSSPLSQFNTAPAGQLTPLPAELMTVIFS